MEQVTADSLKRFGNFSTSKTHNYVSLEGVDVVKEPYKCLKVHKRIALDD